MLLPPGRIRLRAGVHGTKDSGDRNEMRAVQLPLLEAERADTHETQRAAPGEDRAEEEEGDEGLLPGHGAGGQEASGEEAAGAEVERGLPQQRVPVQVRHRAGEGEEEGCGKTEARGGSKC